MAVIRSSVSRCAARTPLPAPVGLNPGAAMAALQQAGGRLLSLAAVLNIRLQNTYYSSYDTNLYGRITPHCYYDSQTSRVSSAALVTSFIYNMHKYIYRHFCISQYTSVEDYNVHKIDV